MALSEWNELRKVLVQMQQWEAERYKEHLKDSDRVATGQLYNSIKAVPSNIVFTTTNETDTFEIYLQMEDYWKYVEADTKPHWPPVDKILQWVKVKRSSLLQRFKGNGKRLPTDNQLAYLVGRKISKFGTTGKPDLQMTINEANKYWVNKIGEAIAKDVNDMAVEIIKYIMQPPK